MKCSKRLKFLTFISLIFLVVACTEDDDQSITASYNSELSGIYDVEAKMFGPDNNTTYNCPDTVWYGQVRWTAEHEEQDAIGSYRIDTRWNSQDIWLEDPVMGSYYHCFSETANDPSLLANGLNGEGSLRIRDEDGKLSWWGASQWGEAYFFEILEIDGAILFLRFQNDYDENFEVRLIRTDGSSWPEELRIE